MAGVPGLHGCAIGQHTAQQPAKNIVRVCRGVSLGIRLADSAAKPVIDMHRLAQALPRAVEHFDTDWLFEIIELRNRFASAFGPAR
ncbi:hypothetical protein D3C75_699170 [compost metagenome]